MNQLTPKGMQLEARALIILQGLLASGHYTNEIIHLKTGEPVGGFIKTENQGSSRTGNQSNEATTKNLCDAVRAALAKGLAL